jgi:hypothetical protein
MARLFRTAILIAFFLSAGRAFAAGGACPTAANYLNTSTGSLVTLSSLGVTSCFYISAAGADTNSGTSEASPWLHAPGMPSCSSNCSSNTPSGGTGYIFRGCDTWTDSSLPVLWNWSGSSGSPIYIGVDQAWYNTTNCPSGWNRPIFDSLKNSISGAYFFNGQGSSLSWGVLDNVEMRSMTDHGAAYVGSFDNSSNWTFSNLYLHAQNVALDGSCAFFAGDGGASNNLVTNTVMDGSDRTGATPDGNGDTGTCYAFYPDMPNVKNSVIHDLANGIVGHANYTIEVGNNLIYNIVFSNNGSHPNAIEIGDGNTHYFHDNVIHDANGETFNLTPASGVAEVDWVWNNLFYRIIGNPPETGGLNSTFTAHWFNNTIANLCDAKTGSCTESGLVCFSAVNFASQIVTNNHCISGSLGASGSTLTTNLQQSSTQADANSSPHFDQYTSSETYAYSPTASSNSTVGAGTNLASSWPAGFSTNETSYACTQQAVNGVVQAVCPTPTSNTRGATWDVGAYQFSSSQTQAPQAPTDLTATVQ